MSARSNDDVGHADSAQGIGKAIGEAGFHAHEVAETEFSFGRRDELVDEVGEGVFEFGENIAGGEFF